MNFEEKLEQAKLVLEVIKEYPDNLQETVFNFLIGENAGIFNKTHHGEEPSNDNDETDEPVKSSKKRRKKTNFQSSSYTNSYKPQLVKSLNLRPEGQPSLIEFFEEKRPEGNIQNSAVMAYYLEKILNLEEITPDHIFTCYMELNKKIPAVIVQNLRDCSSSRYGYIDFVDGKITVSIKGINFITHDLPKTK